MVMMKPNEATTMNRQPNNVARSSRLPMASGQTQVVFVQLDPILKQLLDAVTKYRQLTEAATNARQQQVAGNASNHSSNSESRLLEQWVINVKLQVKLLRDLQATIRTLGPPFAPSLLILADYISLPLTAIFHISPDVRVSAASNGDHGSYWQSKNVSTTYLRMLHQEAADCIQMYSQLVTPVPMRTTPVPSISLSSKHAIQFLVALTRGIPSSPVAIAANNKIVVATMDNKHTNALGDGSDCWLAILHALETVLKACPSSEELVVALDGGLVARLVDCATALVEGGRNNNSIDLVSNDTVRLESVQLLQTLFDQLAKYPKVWQAMFPGILVGLYRCLISCQRQASTGQSVALECGCLGCIQKLLRITLVPIHNHNKQAQQRSTNADVGAASTATTAMLQNLQLLARNANESRQSWPSAVESSSTTNEPKESSSANFLSQVQQRAVAPLIIILRQAMASKASSVCLQATHLCQVVLVETRTCWRGTSLPEVALECCLILQNTTSEDATVAEAAKSVLQAHQKQLGTKDLAALMSKILSLVEELPILSQGGKTIDLKMHLQLLKGYVQALGPKAGKELTASTFPYQPLIQLMEVDFSATSLPSRSLPLLEVIGGGSSVYRGHQSKLPIHRLTLDHAKLAGDVIESLGEALGVKQGAFVVDTLLSDVFEAWTARGTLSLAIMKQWAGSLFVATKVFIGAFSSRSSDEVDPALWKKAEKRRRKILLSLASSILPLLVHAPVQTWTSTSRSIQSTEAGLGTSPQQIKQGIASILVLSLELQSVITSYLETDTEDLITTLLYPTIDKVHANNNSAIVQEAAMDALRSMACACGMNHVHHLLQAEVVRLFAEMLSRLRVPGGSSIPRGGETGETFAVTYSLTWVLSAISKENASEIPYPADDAIISGLIKLANSLMDRLDHLFLNKAVMEEDAFRITEMYSAIFRYITLFFEWHGIEEKQKEDQKQNGCSIGGSWMQLLTAFHLSSKEGFEGQEDEEDDSERSRQEPCSELNGKLTISKSEIDLSSKIISMACYLLSNESLRVQISACESLTWGFQFLSLATKENQERKEAEIRNAVFRQVAMSWPSIKARLSNVTDEIVERKRTVTSLLIVAPPTQTPLSKSSNRDASTQRFFLSRMFQLVASMFECSGDFMADRFKSSVWPVVAKQFAFLMEFQARKQRSTRRGRRVIEEIPSTTRRTNDLVSNVRLDDDSATLLHEWSASERLLLLSMTRCLTRIFGSEESRGTCLARIHQAVGLVLLPFIGDPDDEISSSAMAAIKNIVAQDCDVLLRPLLEMSGREIPRCPIQVSQGEEANDAIFDISSSVETAPEHVGARTQKSRNSKLALGCEEILVFIEHLPEQELL